MRWFDLIETIRAALGMSSNDGRKEGEGEGKMRGESGQVGAIFYFLLFHFPFVICHLSFVGMRTTGLL
jgi:hypothetical protein